MLFNIYIQEENENGEIIKPFEYQCTKEFLDTREAKRTLKEAKIKDLSLKLLELNKILFQYHNLKYYIKIIQLFQKIVMYKNLKENITLIIITVVLATILSIISN